MSSDEAARRWLSDYYAAAQDAGETRWSVRPVRAGLQPITFGRRISVDDIRAITEGNRHMTTDSTRRALRTGIDAILAVLAAFAAVLIFPGLGDALGVSSADMIRAGVVVGALALFFTKIRNALEDKGTIPAVLKAPPSPGANPVPDPNERGDISIGEALVIVLLAAILIALLGGL